MESQNEVHRQTVSLERIAETDGKKFRSGRRKESPNNGPAGGGRTHPRAEHEAARWANGGEGWRAYARGLLRGTSARGGVMVGEGGRTRRQFNASHGRVWVALARACVCRFYTVGVLHQWA